MTVITSEISFKLNFIRVLEHYSIEVILNSSMFEQALLFIQV